MIVSKGKMTKIIDSKGNVTAVPLKENGLYAPFVNVTNKNNGNFSIKEKWHRLLGHINFKYLKVLLKNQH